jgi:4-hydroxy-tetrahydrodipicolinate synthase
MLEAFEAGSVAEARSVHSGLLPVLRAFGRVGGVSFAKTALRLSGLDVGNPRLPLLAPGPDQVTAIAADLAGAGLEVGTS